MGQRLFRTAATRDTGPMLRHVRRVLVYASSALAIVLATIVLTFAVQARLRLAELRPWHRVTLEQEFRANRADAPKSFDEYLKLEDRLFAELRNRVFDDKTAADSLMLGRYNPNSVPAHLALDTPYNRSYEMVPQEPRGAVLLVHGLSDSPYSMRALAESFFAKGYYVLVLRLPGHGTVPASLIDVTWKDWYASVVLAAKHAGERAGNGKPFLACGHSTGAALLALYALRALDDPALPRLEHLYLISPAIGISRFAVLTNVLAGLSFVPAFEKSKWLDVQPEYDPYKYNSFPVNAANQIHTLTRVLRRALDDAGQRGKLGAMPRILVFQSLVDSTVTAADVVGGLLARLPARGNELCVFDVNRRDRLEGLLAPLPMEGLERLKATPDLPFRLTIVGNRPGGTTDVALYTREPGEREFAVSDQPLQWPRGVFSLGHVALPFPPDDPVYGFAPKAGAEDDFNLGAVSARGEAGALLMPFDAFVRLRSNPFFDVIKARIDESLRDDAR